MVDDKNVDNSLKNSTDTLKDKAAAAEKKNSQETTNDESKKVKVACKLSNGAQIKVKSKIVLINGLNTTNKPIAYTDIDRADWDQMTNNPLVENGFITLVK